MSNILVISGHPDLRKSNTNTVILDRLTAGPGQVDIRDLGALYPDYNINIEAEQQALLKADVIVLQFPFYWYSVPALLKKWLDDVFAYNFAYGAEGDKLKGKDFFLSFTIGGPEESYGPLGYNHFSIEDLIRPLQQTAYLAGLRFHKPVYTNRMVYIPGVYNQLEDVQSRARDHADRLMEAIQAVTTAPDAVISKFVASWFSRFDQLPEDNAFFLSHLSDDINLDMPEGRFDGHDGFRDWYAIARQTFKPDCRHHVEQIEISTNGEGFQTDLRIRLKAKTWPHSKMNGDDIDLLVNETWQVRLDAQNKVTINDYHVQPVAA